MVVAAAAIPFTALGVCACPPTIVFIKIFICENKERKCGARVVHVCALEGNR